MQCVVSGVVYGVWSVSCKCVVSVVVSGAFCGVVKVVVWCGVVSDVQCWQTCAEHYQCPGVSLGWP